MAVSKGITRILGNVAVLFASLAFSIFIAESLARVVVDPVDYLNPTVVPDEYLGHRIEGNTGGHDAWGFRNSRVPEIADIVCIGDSQTYGVAARASESWPAVLGKIRNQTVYNLALGGYGPIQYLHLMRTYTGRLKPKMVIVGLYFGNDMMDAYNMVRFNKNWRAYETLEGPEIAAPRLVSQYSPKFLRGLRVWLAGHSLLYAMARSVPIIDSFRRRETAGFMPEYHPEYRDDKHDALFNLEKQVRFLDMRDSRIKAGMKITKRVMMDMKSEAEKQHFRLIIALIPTKERVYSQLLQRSHFTDKNLLVAEALGNETEAHELLDRFLRSNSFEVIDTLPTLQTAVENRDIYPFAESHPNKDGYRIIAKTIDQYLHATR